MSKRATKRKLPESSGSSAVEVVTPDMRRQYAWRRLKEWAPRVQVVEELQERFGIKKSVAYDDISRVFEELAEMRKMSRRAEAEALLVQIDDQIQRLRYANEAETFKAGALSRLWDMRAKLTGAYRDPNRVAVVFAEFKQLSGLDDAAIDALIEAEQKLLGPGQS